jgi:DNA replication factor GINS
MGLDDLRSILLSERETGKLIQIPPDIFERTHVRIASLLEKVYAIEDPLSDQARALIEETIAVKETLHDLFAIRSRKILALTVLHAEDNYYDRDEVKRMIAPEREMFEQFTAAIERCQEILLKNVRPSLISPAVTITGGDELETEEILEQESDASTGGIAQNLSTGGPPSLSPPYTLVRVLEDTETFMGIDGRIYTLSKGDIVTLPERNAAVLSERNIVLNMNLGN